MPPSAIPSPIPSTPTPAGARSAIAPTRSSHPGRATPAAEQRSDRADANPSTFEDRLGDARRANEPVETPETPETPDSAPAGEHSEAAEAPSTESSTEPKTKPAAPAAPDDAETPEAIDDADPEPADATTGIESAQPPVVEAQNAPRAPAEPAPIESDDLDTQPTQAKPTTPEQARSSITKPGPRPTEGDSAPAQATAPSADGDTAARSAPDQPASATAGKPQNKPVVPADLRPASATASDTDAPEQTTAAKDGPPAVDADRSARARRAVRDAQRAFNPVPREGEGGDARVPGQTEPPPAQNVARTPVPVERTLPGEQPAAPTAPGGAGAEAQASAQGASGAPGAVQATGATGGSRFDEDQQQHSADDEGASDRRQPNGRGAQRVESSGGRASESTTAQSNQSNTAAHEVRTVGEPRASSPAPAAQQGQSPSSGQPNPQAEQAAVASANRGLEVALKQQGGSVRLRMSPETLGALKVEMTIARGAVSANLRASTAEAHELLSRNIDTLRAALEAKGLSVERLSITLAPASQGGSSGHASTNNGNAQSQQHSSNSGASTQQQNGEHDAGGERSKGFFERHQRRHASHDDAQDQNPAHTTEERLFRYRFGLHAIG